MVVPAAVGASYGCSLGGGLDQVFINAVTALTSLTGGRVLLVQAAHLYCLLLLFLLLTCSIIYCCLAATSTPSLNSTLRYSELPISY